MRPRTTRAAWLLLAGASLMGCSVLEREAVTPEPCASADRTVILGSTTLEDAEPSAAFDVAEGRDVFVTLLADPDFNAGAGLNGGLLLAPVYVIADGEVPQPGVPNEDGFPQPTLDFRVPQHRNVGESRFLDRPDGSYRLWSRGGPVVDVFSCLSADDSSG